MIAANLSTWNGLCQKRSCQGRSQHDNVQFFNQFYLILPARVCLIRWWWSDWQETNRVFKGTINVPDPGWLADSHVYAVLLYIKQQSHLYEVPDISIEEASSPTTSPSTHADSVYTSHWMLSHVWCVTTRVWTSFSSQKHNCSTKKGSIFRTQPPWRHRPTSRPVQSFHRPLLARQYQSQSARPSTWSSVLFKQQIFPTCTNSVLSKQSWSIPQPERSVHLLQQHRPGWTDIFLHMMPRPTTSRSGSRKENHGNISVFLEVIFSNHFLT